MPLSQLLLQHGLPTREVGKVLKNIKNKKKTEVGPVQKFVDSLPKSPNQTTLTQCLPFHTIEEAEQKPHPDRFIPIVKIKNEHSMKEFLPYEDPSDKVFLQDYNMTPL